MRWNACLFATILPLLAACLKRGEIAASTPRPPEASPGAAIDREAAMAEVEAGPFRMGCDPGREPLCEADESPEHEVTLPAFRIDRTEVTQAAYAACVAAGACTTPYHGSTPWEGGACASAQKSVRGDHAVTCVSWADADAFCRWAGKRLPTEAEWEKAARGSDGRRYPWGNDEPDCVHAALAGCPDAAVGAHPAGRSPYGVLDLAGGVWEWTASWYSPTAYSEVAADPDHPPANEFRVVRGADLNGSHAGVHDYRAANRFALAPEHVSSRLGFRCAR